MNMQVHWLKFLFYPSLTDDYDWKICKVCTTLRSTEITYHEQL